MRTPIAGPNTALLLDAAGTLLSPAEPVAQTYARIAREHGVEVTSAYVGERGRRALHRQRRPRAARRID
jgi:hypothetical protein